MPHRKLEEKLFSYLTTIDSIEILTGLDFLNELPDSIEDKIESTKLWISDFWDTAQE